MPEAMTLAEHTKDSDAITRAVVDIYQDTSDILRAMPFMNISGNAYRYNVEDALPGIAFRGVNEPYTADIGVENPLTESLSIAGGDLDVDNFLVATQGEGRRARETSKKAKQMARTITTAILHGDSSSNPREFDGLQRRLTGTQLIQNSTASGGGPLSLLALDDLISQVANPTHLIMPRRFRDVLFPAVTRNQTLMGNAQFDIEKSDADVGRKVYRYNGLEILVGYEVGPDAAILPFTEPATNGGQLQTTSIYCVSLQEGHLCGIQSSAMEARDLGEIDDAPVKRVRAEWYCGQVLEHPYGAARLKDITNAAIAA